MIITFKQLKQCDIYFVKRFIRYKLSHIKNEEFEFLLDEFNTLWMKDDCLYYLFSDCEIDYNEKEKWINYCDNLRYEKDEYSEFS